MSWFPARPSCQTTVVPLIRGTEASVPGPRPNHVSVSGSRTFRAFVSAEKSVSMHTTLSPETAGCRETCVDVTASRRTFGPVPVVERSSRRTLEPYPSISGCACQTTREPETSGKRFRSPGVVVLTSTGVPALTVLA
ncbi:hypothetical protein DSECCO2_378060 [anaerobic digester metagenome]